MLDGPMRTSAHVAKLHATRQVVHTLFHTHHSQHTVFKIHDFNEIAADFSHTLLLGNGASMAIDACFSYGTLLGHARSEGLVTEDVEAVFDHLETSDFELVMRMLRHAYHVNRALGISEDRTQPAYEALRDALIQSVRDTHVEHQNVVPHAEAIHNFMSRYDLVLSLNYDLTVYWAMLRGNEAHGGNRFKDCWVRGTFDGDWNRFQEPMRGMDGSTLVFYPHGNLTLATSLDQGEAKFQLETGDANLLERIIAEWESADYLPLFVSEGESKQKEAAISRSGYLSTVFNDVMTSLGESVTVYGWSMAENDHHILRRVCAPAVSRLAVSVYRGGKTDRQLHPYCLNLKSRIRELNDRVSIRFFDAESDSCWLKYSESE